MPISVPIVFRSFLQYSFEWFADSNHIPYNENSLSCLIMAFYSPLRFPGGKTKMSKDSLRIIYENNLNGCTLLSPLREVLIWL